MQWLRLSQISSVQTLKSLDLSPLINGQSQKKPLGPTTTVHGNKIITVNIKATSWETETVVTAYLGDRTLVKRKFLSGEGKDLAQGDFLCVP